MKSLLCIPIALSLVGCAGPQGVIKIVTPPEDPGIEIIDERPNEEKVRGAVASCENHGPKWIGVSDAAFEPTRMSILGGHLAELVGESVKKVTVRRFQNCYQVNSLSNTAGLAGVSYVLAVVAESQYKPGTDFVLTYLELSIDGHTILASDLRPYKQRRPMLHHLEEKETTDTIALSTKAAIRQAAEKIREIRGASRPMERTR